MKKKLLVSALVLGAGSMMLMGFDSAATAEDVLEKYMEATQDVNEFSADMDMNLSFGMSVSSEASGTSDLNAGVKADMAIDYTKNPLSMKMEGSMAITSPDGDESADMQVYMVPGDDGAWDIFAKLVADSMDEWEYSAIPAEQMTQITDLMNNNQMDISQFPAEFTLGDSAVDVNGTSCYQLTATITYEDLAPYVQQALETSGQEVDESTLSIIEMALSGLALNMEMDVAVDTYYPMAIHLDMTGSDLTALTQILAYSMAEADDEGNLNMPEISIDISNMYIDATYDYSPVEAITVPEEALSAKENSDGTSELSELAEEVMDEVAE